MKYPFLVLFLSIVTPIIAADFADDSWSQELFAGDLAIPFTEQGPYRTRQPYLNPDTLPKAAAAALRALHPGLTRAECQGWRMNSGLTFNEYVHSEQLSGQSLAVRMVFRPAAMPESVFSDATARRAWLHDHKPDEAPTDVLMKVGKPFATASALD